MSDQLSDGSKKIENGRGAEDTLSAPSSFIANTLDDLYAFYTKNAAF